MASNAFIGIIGGAAGFGNAMNYIGKDQLRNLADKLKIQARGEIEKQLQGERITAEQQMNQDRISSQESMNTQRLKSNEKISSEHNAVLERIAKDKNDLSILLSKYKTGSSEAKDVANKLKAMDLVQKTIQNGGDINQINAILDAAGLPRWEQYTKTPGSSGFFGWGATEPVTGYRLAGSGGSQLSNDLNTLLAEGKKEGLLSGLWGTGVAQAADNKENDGVWPPKGIIGGQINKIIPNLRINPDPRAWSVQKRGNDYFMNTGAGYIKMTPEQVDQWKRATEGVQAQGM
jgi:hypothetical protein